MDINVQTNLIEKMLNNLKSKVFGLNLSYKLEYLPKNENAGAYSKLYNCYVEITGTPQIPYFTKRILQYEIYDTLNKMFRFMFPDYHPLQGKEFRIDFKFKYGKIDLTARSIIMSEETKKYLKKYVGENKKGEMRSYGIPYSINYSNMESEEYVDNDDIEFFFPITFESLNYIKGNGDNVLIDDEMIDDFCNEFGYEKEEFLDAIICYFNERSLNNGTPFANEFADKIDLGKYLSLKTRENIGWRYLVGCRPLEGHGWDWDAGSFEYSVKNNFLSYFRDRLD